MQSSRKRNRDYEDHSSRYSSQDRSSKRDASTSKSSRPAVGEGREEGELIEFDNGDSRAQTPVLLSQADTPPAVEQIPAIVQHHKTNEMDIDLTIARPDIDIDKAMQEKRRRRAEILAKYASGKPLIQSLVPSNAQESASGTASAGLASPAKKLRIDSPVVQSRPSTPELVSRPPTAVSSPSLSQRVLEQSKDGTATPDTLNGDDGEINGNMLLAKDSSKDVETVIDDAQDQEEVSAADYNPDNDRRLDDARQLALQGPQSHAAGQVGVTALASEEIDAAESDQEIEIEVEEDVIDDDDMFAVLTAPAKRKKVIKVKKHQSGRAGSKMVVINRATAAGAAALDDHDDADGYYKVILGELLDGTRYHVHANLGRGMFSSVVRAKDTEDDGREVAIKMIRSQESMYKAGQKEAAILRKLHEADPADKKHIVRLHRTFDHRGHLCLVFESLSMNLREVVKRFGKDVGINLRAVRAYAHQMFLGLNLLKKCDVMHADIKPDNLLINENHSQLKISDLGSASDISENDITPYLASRFYRAPEIILGLPYDCALDMWAIGCTLYELYTGKILFPGRNNNQMLLLMQELKGRIVGRSIKKSRFGEMHFDDQGNFLSAELNKMTGTEAIKKINLPAKPVRDLRTRLMPISQVKRMAADDAKLLGNFVDLLDRSLDLEPAKRLTPRDALSHPFLR